VARPDLGTVANRLFDGFLGPLVVGGDVFPGRPIGARSALAMGRERVIADSDLYARVQLARTRVARKLTAVDDLPGPTEAEWAIGAALHDIVQTAHPAFDSAFRRKGPPRILDLAEATLERVPAPRSVGEALSRHTWFSRLFEMERTDTVIRWWVGSRTFLGEKPPARLAAWPELRRVHVETTARAVMDLPGAGGAVDPTRFGVSLGRLLAKTPLTDLATCHRPAPVFSWGSESLGLIATPPGRALAGRALAWAPKSAADAGLGRATRALVAARAWSAVSVALDLLAERALVDAELANSVSVEGSRWARRGAADEGTRAGTPSPPKDDDAGYARSVGALAACMQLRAHGAPFSDTDRAELLARLTPAATSPIARAVQAELAGSR
jgi:hypothetical protein